MNNNYLENLTWDRVINWIKIMNPKHAEEYEKSGFISIASLKWEIKEHLERNNINLDPPCVDHISDLIYGYAKSDPEKLTVKG